MIVDVNDLLGEDEIYLPINIMSLDEIGNIFWDISENMSEKSYGNWYEKKNKLYLDRLFINYKYYEEKLKKLEKNITDLICQNLNDNYDKVYEIVTINRFLYFNGKTYIEKQYNMTRLYYLRKVREYFKRIINKLKMTKGDK